MSYQHIQTPSFGEKISVNRDFSLNVPEQPVIPFIEGDGIGCDITPAMRQVIDAAVSKAYELPLWARRLLTGGNTERYS